MPRSLAHSRVPLRLAGSGTAAVLVGLAGLAFYVATLAPTLLWGDDAELQRIVQTGEPRTLGQSSAASHLLWLALARRFVAATTWLPLDPAGRTNLVAALCAAAALPLVFLAALELAAAGAGEAEAGAHVALFVPPGATIAGLAAAVALGLSHTFWLLAVRPDAYTLQMALLAAAVWLVLRWRRTAHPTALLGAAACTAAALLNHPMILASVPALAWLALSPGGAAPRRLVPAAAIAGAATLAGLAVAVAAGVPLAALVATLARFRPQLASPRDVLAVPAYLLYQFPPALVLALPGAWRLWQMRRAILAGLVILYAGNAVLPLTFYVRDRFLFFLPSYLPVALLIGLGAAELAERGLTLRRVSAPATEPIARCTLGPKPRPPGVEVGCKESGGADTTGQTAGRPRARRLLLAALLAAPLAVYPLAAATAGAAATRLAPARRLPERDPVAFYLLPPKAGYFGARHYATQAMQMLAPGAAVVADWLLYQPLRYLQQVEGVRPDVELAMINAGGGAQLRFLLAQPAGRPLYLADDSPPPYYELDDISRCFRLAPEGPVFRLQPRPGVPCAP